MARAVKSKPLMLTSFQSQGDRVSCLSIMWINVRFHDCLGLYQYSTDRTSPTGSTYRLDPWHSLVHGLDIRSVGDMFE